MSLGLLLSWDHRSGETCRCFSISALPITQPCHTALPLPPGQSIGCLVPLPVCTRLGICGGRRTSHPCTVPSVTDPSSCLQKPYRQGTCNHLHRTSVLPFQCRVSGSSSQCSGAYLPVVLCHKLGSINHLPSKGKGGAWQINLQFCSWTGKSAKPILKQVIMRWKGQDYTAPYRCFAMPRCISCSRGLPHRSRQ